MNPSPLSSICSNCGEAGENGSALSAAACPSATRARLAVSSFYQFTLLSAQLKLWPESFLKVSQKVTQFLHPLTWFFRSHILPALSLSRSIDTRPTSITVRSDQPGTGGGSGIESCTSPILESSPTQSLPFFQQKWDKIRKSKFLS